MRLKKWFAGPEKLNLPPKRRTAPVSYPTAYIIIYIVLKQLMTKFVSLDFRSKILGPQLIEKNTNLSSLDSQKF